MEQCLQTNQLTINFSCGQEACTVESWVIWCSEDFLFGEIKSGKLFLASLQILVLRSQCFSYFPALTHLIESCFRCGMCLKMCSVLYRFRLAHCWPDMFPCLNISGCCNTQSLLTSVFSLFHTR